MKKFVKCGLVLGFAVVLTGCEKKEEAPVIVEPPIVKETQSAIKRTLKAAKEKAAGLKESTAEKTASLKDSATDKTEGLKESAGEAIEKATDTVKGFGSHAGDVIQKAKPGLDE